MNGINKYVTETSEEIPFASVGDTSTGKLVAKTRPRPTPTFQPRLFWSVKNHDQITATLRLNPHYSEHVLYITAIQGRSGGTLVDPTLQDNVLLPDDFADYICHIGNAHEMHSIIQCGLIPGGKRVKRDRQSVSSRKNSIVVQFEARSEERIAVLSNAIPRSRSFQHTACYVLRKWYAWRLERIYTAKYTNPQGYRESYSRPICSMDVRILLIPKRENPPTIKANIACSTGKPVAVMLITEFKVDVTQQFRKTTPIASKS